MKKTAFYLILAFLSLGHIDDFAQTDEVKPWTDVVIDNRDPSLWTWNKNNSSRFSIRGDFDGDGFSENLYETATTIFSDNDELTPLKLDGD
ncbi:MAG: hypothetical protein J6Q96_00005, partial [Bacteroidales bacterium]|nr:hypothetical protein [Bacteroidales bacterium]